MHYVGLSRVSNSSALHVRILYENKVKVSEKTNKEMTIELQRQLECILHVCCFTGHLIM